jgi:hypothetical protein
VVYGPPAPFVTHLPEVKDKPAHLTRASIRPQDERYPRVDKVIGKGGQCVSLAQKHGFNIYTGAAKGWPSAAKKLGYVVDKTPEKGAVIVTSESSAGTNTGHVMIITGEVVEGYIPIIESNYRRLTITSGYIAKNDPRIRAIIHPKAS